MLRQDMWRCGSIAAVLRSRARFSGLVAAAQRGFTWAAGGNRPLRLPRCQPHDPPITKS